MQPHNHLCACMHAQESSAKKDISVLAGKARESEVALGVRGVARAKPGLGRRGRAASSYVLPSVNCVICVVCRGGQNKMCANHPLSMLGEVSEQKGRTSVDEQTDPKLLLFRSAV